MAVEGARQRGPVLWDESEQARGIGHLAPGQLVLGVAFEARVVDPPDPWMGFEETGDGKGVRLVAFHAQGQRVHAAHDRPGAEGIERAADMDQRVLAERRHGPRIADDRAAERVAMAAEVFGERVDDVVGAEVQRSGGDGRGDGRVDRELRPVIMGDRGYRGDVGEPDDRVARGLGVQQPGVRTHGAATSSGSEKSARPTSMPKRVSLSRASSATPA